MEKNNPWLALSTYEEEDKDKFKGREQDTQNMLTMLLQNEYVVCYAASGDGKSSLINAGVCPEMRKVGYYPIKIVFSTDEYEGINIPQNENGKIDFDTCILKKIEEAISQVNRRSKESENQIEFKVDEQFVSFPAYLSTNLWWKLRTQIIQAQVGYGKFDYIPVLIFDQFEEILRAKWKNEFFEWLETLSSDECPDAIYSSVSDYEKLPSRKKFKAIFSMRYEYVGELDYWTSQRYFIPQMMRGRYFLKPFTIEQAELIIKEHQSDDVASQQLSINANNIASNLADTDNNVSAIMLSLLSYILYDQWSLNKDYEFTPQNVARLMFTHYENILSRCKISDKERNALESALISSNGARRRMPLSDERLSIFAGDAGNSKIEYLVKEHILRQNDDYIEIVHDRLVEAIYEGNKKRKEEELIQRKKRTRSRIVYGLLFCAILGLIGWVLYYSLAKVQYVEHITESTWGEGFICNKDTLYIENFSDSNNIYVFNFKGNPSIRNVVIKGGRITIGGKAFFSCKNLGSLRIMANNCWVGMDAFSGTKIREIIIEGDNNQWYSDADTIESVSVKGNGNYLCIPQVKSGNVQIVNVEGSNDSLLVGHDFDVDYLRLVNAEHLYWDKWDSYEIPIRIKSMDILRGTSFDTSSTFKGGLNVGKLFLEGDTMFNRLDDKTLDVTPRIIFEEEVFQAKRFEEQSGSPKDNLERAISVSVDEYIRANEAEKSQLIAKASSFHGYNDTVFAYGNIIYEIHYSGDTNLTHPYGNTYSLTTKSARLAEVIKLPYKQGSYDIDFGPETKDIYVLDLKQRGILRCESRNTRVHVPYGYGEYCRSNNERFSNCTIVEMSVFETIYERLLFTVVEDYHVNTIIFYLRILILLVCLCFTVYGAKKRKYENIASDCTFGILIFILILAWNKLGMPKLKDLLGVLDEVWWAIIIYSFILFLLWGVIIWYVHNRKKAKKYAIIFGSDEAKKAAFSILDKIYKEGGNDDVFLVSNYKKDWDFKKHRWTKNTIVLLTKDELLEKNNEYVKFLSHLKTDGFIRPIVLGVACNQDIVWPHELRKFGRRHNLSVFKALPLLSKDLRENDLDEIYKSINKRKDGRIRKLDLSTRFLSLEIILTFFLLIILIALLIVKMAL